MTSPFRGAFAPLRWLSQLVAMSIVPVGLFLLAYWLLDRTGMPFWLVAVTVGLYEMFVLWAWCTAVAGQLRSLARGPHVIRTHTRRPRRRRNIGEEEL
ncbi:hypothetical protein N8J89_12800 [Crossiella sp. CA-258035]|uniref:hypothetical protein n=1 Tax=Crossiella sp. CA-258035 TaxID=2981138 RepID=UPI0024BCE943|nr:hypothetical protein [Crossiella sp. CA-258035]WHT21899.1 hypothetical protein N8J89_12800 [Crossiella sp. CA-258035]